MDFKQYEKVAASTAIFPKSRSVVYCTLGLVSEAGEVADKIKKYIREGNDPDGDIPDELRDGLAKELGDVLWYVSVLANRLDYNLEDIALMNAKKLSSRQVRGVLQGSGDER